MTTSSADKQDVVKAISYGCDGYMIKPYDQQSIEEQLIKLSLYNPEATNGESSKEENLA